MYRAKCRKCSGKKLWKVRRGKLRCKNCKYEFVPKVGGVGTTKQPVFGILARNGKVWATIVPATEARDLIPIIKKRIKKGTRINSDTWRAYTGLATKGYVHRTVEHEKEEYVKGSNHINGLEGFFGYLKRQLASRGGIRKERLSYYLAEYVWRYNYRKLSIEKKVKRLLNLVANI